MSYLKWAMARWIELIAGALAVFIIALFLFHSRTTPQAASAPPPTLETLKKEAEGAPAAPGDLATAGLIQAVPLTPKNKISQAFSVCGGPVKGFSLTVVTWSLPTAGDYAIDWTLSAPAGRLQRGSFSAKGPTDWSRVAIQTAPVKGRGLTLTLSVNAKQKATPPLGVVISTPVGVQPANINGSPAPGALRVNVLSKPWKTCVSPAKALN